MKSGTAGDWRASDMAKHDPSASRDNFRSKWGFKLACIGSAVGMGNIWLFPSRMSQYGATFLIPYFLFVALIASTGVIGEMAFGRAAAIVYEIYDSILAPMAFHAVANLFVYVMMDLMPFGGVFVTLPACVFFLLISAVSLVLMVKWQKGAA